jgi:hypothetical protein
MAQLKRIIEKRTGTVQYVRDAGETQKQFVNKVTTGEINPAELINDFFKKKTLMSLKTPTDFSHAQWSSVEIK